MHHVVDRSVTTQQGGFASSSNNPIIPPPEGVSSDFAHPTNYGQPQIAVSPFLLCITTVFTLNRIYMKTFIARKYMLDDLKFHYK